MADTQRITKKEKANSTAQYRRGYEKAKKRMKADRAGVIGFLWGQMKQSLSVLKKPWHLLPTIALGGIWYYLSVLWATVSQIDSIPTWQRIVSYITFAQGGMYGGLISASGGILGKAVIAAFLNTFIIAIFEKKKPITNTLRGIGGIAKNGAISGIHDLSALFGGAGFAILIYGFMNSRQGLAESMVGIAALIMVFKSIGDEGGFVAGLFVSMANTFSRGRTPSYKTVNRFLTGTGIGFAIGIGLSATPYRICILVGMVLVLLGFILMPRRKKRSSNTKVLAMIFIFVACEMIGVVCNKQVLNAAPFSSTMTSENGDISISIDGGKNFVEKKTDGNFKKIRGELKRGETLSISVQSNGGESWSGNYDVKGSKTGLFDEWESDQTEARLEVVSLNKSGKNSLKDHVLKLAKKDQTVSITLQYGEEGSGFVLDLTLVDAYGKQDKADSVETFNYQIDAGVVGKLIISIEGGRGFKVRPIDISENSKTAQMYTSILETTYEQVIDGTLKRGEPMRITVTRETPTEAYDGGGMHHPGYLGWSYFLNNYDIPMKGKNDIELSDHLLGYVDIYEPRGTGYVNGLPDKQISTWTDHSVTLEFTGESEINVEGQVVCVSTREMKRLEDRQDLQFEFEENSSVQDDTDEYIEWDTSGKDHLDIEDVYDRFTDIKDLRDEGRFVINLDLVDQYTVSDEENEDDYWSNVVNGNGNGNDTVNDNVIENENYIFVRDDDDKWIAWDKHADPEDSANRAIMGTVMAILFGMGGAMSGGMTLGGGVNASTKNLKGWKENKDGDITIIDPTSKRELKYYHIGNDPETGKARYISGETDREVDYSDIRSIYDSRIENSGYYAYNDTVSAYNKEYHHQDFQNNIVRESENTEREIKDKIRAMEHEQYMLDKYGDRYLKDRKGIKKELREKLKNDEVDRYNHEIRAIWMNFGAQTANQVTSIADTTINALAEVTGPVGKQIKTIYSVAKPGLTKFSEAFVKGKKIKEALKDLGHGTLEGAIDIYADDRGKYSSKIVAGVFKKSLESYREDKSFSETMKAVAEGVVSDSISYTADQAVSFLVKGATDKMNSRMQKDIDINNLRLDRLGAMGSNRLGKTMNKLKLVEQAATKDRIELYKNSVNAFAGVVKDGLQKLNIDKDLNIDPYQETFDESKGFYEGLVDNASGYVGDWVQKGTQRLGKTVRTVEDHNAYMQNKNLNKHNSD